MHAIFVITITTTTIIIITTTITIIIIIIIIIIINSEAQTLGKRRCQLRFLRGYILMITKRG